MPRAAAVVWASEAGRAKCLALLGERYPHIDVSGITAEWWADNVSGRDSKLALPCDACRFVAAPSIKNFVNGQGIGCRCTAETAPPRWATEQGRDLCLKQLEECFPDADTSAMTPTWWRDGIVSNESKLSIDCLRCNSHVTPAIKNVVYGGSGIGCGCALRAARNARPRGEGQWGSKAGRERCFAILTDRFPDADLSTMDQPWWDENVVAATSKLSVLCGICHRRGTPTIAHIRCGQGLGCGCRQPPRRAESSSSSGGVVAQAGAKRPRSPSSA